jgi:hypothetical protein
MTALLVAITLALLAGVAILSTVIVASRDGYRRSSTLTR